MRNLKNALGKEDGEVSGNAYSESMRTLKHNDTQSMWSIGMASEESEEEICSDPLVITGIIEVITAMQKEGKIADENAYIEIQKSLPKIIGDKKYSEKESSNLLSLLLSKALTKAPPSIEDFLARMLEISKSKNRKKKTKAKTGAMEFDQIATKLFKKTGQQGAKENKKRFLEVNLSPQVLKRSARKSNKKHDSKNSGSGSRDSGEGKLGKLLSSDRYDIKKSEISGPNNEKEEATEEGYSFSAVMSASVAVKQRQPRNNKQQKQRANFTNAREENQDAEKDKDKEDAFIFFRPKKNRR